MIPVGECVCSVCGVLKDNTEFTFYKDRKTSDGFRLRVNTNCKKCQKNNAKDLREAKKFAISIGKPQPDFGELCDCCDRPVYKNKKSIPLDIVNGTYGWQCDHEHGTSNFRGWICKPCNTGVGSLGDSIEGLERAIKYLKKGI